MLSLAPALRDLQHPSGGRARYRGRRRTPAGVRRCAPPGNTALPLPPTCSHFRLMRLRRRAHDQHAAADQLRLRAPPQRCVIARQLARVPICKCACLRTRAEYEGVALDIGLSDADELFRKRGLCVCVCVDVEYGRRELTGRGQATRITSSATTTWPSIPWCGSTDRCRVHSSMLCGTCPARLCRRRTAMLH